MDFTPQLLLSAAFICFLRITDTSMDTLRVLFIMRGRKGLAWLLGFFESIIFRRRHLNRRERFGQSYQHGGVCRWVCDRKLLGDDH
ncbi:MAG: hypothetical protein HC806_07735 [Anaerolineae bacterium]|nr:hypothetical protein [Anaerolineae bacterium]